jgi:hypothetical protein
MAYSGRVTQMCHRALLNAFDRATIEQFAIVHLGTEFENVTRRGNFSDEVWDLVRWADSEDGRLRAMMTSAAAELPGNALLREVVKHLENPEYVESRWYAKYVPLATWLVWVVNLCLIVAAFTVWMVNLLDLRRIFLFGALAAVVGLLGWLLYQRLVGGPIRTFSGFLLVQRLVAHSRLGPRDWLAFAVTIGIALLLTQVVRAAPPPVQASFERGTIESVWRDSEFVVVKQFEALSTMAAQNESSAGGHARNRFSPTYYRVDFYAGAINAPREISVQIELIHPSAADLSDQRARQSNGVTFADVALDEQLAAVVDDRVIGAGANARLSVFDRSISFSLPLEQFKGHHTVLFTCHRALDAQPNPSEVVVYAQLTDSKDGGVLSKARRVSSIGDWASGLAHGAADSIRALLSIRPGGIRADAASPMELLLHLSGPGARRALAIRSGRS